MSRVRPPSEPGGESEAVRILVMGDAGQVGDLVGGMGHQWVAVSNPADVHARLGAESFALLLVDIDMLGELGLKLVDQILAEYPETAAIVITGLDDPHVAHSALELGAYGYIVKPFRPIELTIAVDNALRRQRLELENRSHREALAEIVRTRTAALERTARQLKLTGQETVRRLARAIEYRDEETGGHTERMSRYCAVLARRIGLDSESIRIASPMHDVGKVAVPDHILLKAGPLTLEERREMERHTTVGHEILSGSGSALLELAATIALTHHERFDGSGYPQGLAGDEIPLEGRIAAIADVFDALTSERSYRPAFGLGDAVRMMSEARRRDFDPDLLDAFLQSTDEIVQISVQFADESSRPPLRAPAAIV